MCQKNEGNEGSHLLTIWAENGSLLGPLGPHVPKTGSQDPK